MPEPLNRKGLSRSLLNGQENRRTNGQECPLQTIAPFSVNRLHSPSVSTLHQAVPATATSAGR